jgi:hypothetical protein
VNVEKGSGKILTHPEIPALEASSFLDEINEFDHQNPTSIDDDTTICLSGYVTQFQHVVLFVVTSIQN